MGQGVKAMHQLFLNFFYLFLRKIFIFLFYIIIFIILNYYFYKVLIFRGGVRGRGGNYPLTPHKNAHRAR